MAYLEVWETDKDEEYLWAKGPGIAVIVVSDAVFGLLLPPLVYMDTSQNPPLLFLLRHSYTYMIIAISMARKQESAVLVGRNIPCRF